MASTVTTAAPPPTMASATMATAKQQETMLLTEHFSWPPISLLDDIINAINEVLYRCTDSFETGLMAADPSLLGFTTSDAAQDETDAEKLRARAKLELEEGILKLETLMENAVDRNFDRLEIWTLRNVLCLPRDRKPDGVEGEADEGLAPWMRLGHYAHIAPSTATAEKEKALSPESLHALRRKLIETRRLRSALESEKKRNEAQIARLRDLLTPKGAKATTKAEAETQASPFAFLTQAPAARALGINASTAQPTGTAGAGGAGENKQEQEQEKPLSTHALFTTSQLPALRELLAALKPHLGSTALPLPDDSTNSSSGVSASGSASSTSMARKHYLESQTRWILQRQGVDVRDGVEGQFSSGAGAGRGDGDGLRALEGLVGAGVFRTQQNARGDGEGEGEEMDTS